MPPQVANGMMKEATLASEVVWDLVVRLSHWTMAVGFFVAYFAEDVLTLQVWAGYAVGVVVLLRIVWGFAGPKHARFKDFLYRPSEVVTYLRDLLALRAKRYVGHSPAGGAMVVALLVGLTAVVGSGLALYAIEDHAGPLAGIVTGANAPDGAAILSEGGGLDDDHGGVFAAAQAEGAGELWGEIHEVAANLTLLLVALHVAGVLLASFVHRENLARAMVTGRKRP